MQKRQKRIGLKLHIRMIFLALSAILLFAFQNCGNAIQVTDELVGSVALSESNTDVEALPEEIAQPQPEPSDQQDPLNPPISNLPEVLPVEPTAPPSGAPPAPEVPVIPVVEIPPANPYDPTTPGISLLPIEGEWSSIAFEDNIGDAGAGDRDFNDAVFNYKIAEQYNAQSMLIRIFIEVRLREKLSSSNHKLNLALNGNPSTFFNNISHRSRSAFYGEADTKITNSNGTVTLLENSREQLITVFSSTNDRKGEVVKLEINLKQPEMNVKTPNNTSVDYKKYRFILQNHGQNRTGIDIAEINPTRAMLSNANNYPFGFMIPADWQPPAEGQLIDRLYPNFIHYRSWLVESQNGTRPQSELAASWYLLGN